MSGTQQAFAEMDERVEALRRELAEVRRERDAAKAELRALALVCYGREDAVVTPHELGQILQERMEAMTELAAQQRPTDQ